MILEEGIGELFRRLLNKLLEVLLPDKYRFKINTFVNYLINSFLYNASTDAKKIIYVQTNEIKIRNKKVSEKLGLGQVRSGNWDILDSPIYVNEEWQVIGLKQRFQEQKKWSNTIYYRNLTDIMGGTEENGNINQHNMEQIKCRLKYLDKLFTKIKNEGYMNANQTSNNYKNNYRDDLEILVCIGRHGEIYHYDGIHRLAIAQILNIDKVPVQVVCRHTKWQQKRDDIHNNGFSKRHKRLLNHPDLQKYS